MLVLVEVSLEPAPESTPCGVVSSVLVPPPAPERTVAQPGQDTAKQGVVVRMCSRARVIHKPGLSSPSSSESRCNSAKGFEVFMVDCTGGASECCDRRGTVCHPSSSSVGSASNISCMELDCSAEAFLVIVVFTDICTQGQRVTSASNKIESTSLAGIYFMDLITQPVWYTDAFDTSVLLVMYET